MNKKILLVEDDPLLIDIYTTKLRNEGFEVAVATDGEEALTKHKEFMPDLIILDLIMPQFDGFQFLEVLKTDFKRMPPVIILTNLDKEWSETRGKELGVKRYFVKTKVSPEEVVEEIKKILKK